MNNFVMRTSGVDFMVNSTVAVIFPDNIFVIKFDLKHGY